MNLSAGKKQTHIEHKPVSPCDQPNEEIEEFSRTNGTKWRFGSLHRINHLFQISIVPKIGMETSPPASKFRFRDHGNDMEIGESVIDDTSSESTSVTSDEDSEIESEDLASMTAKGINHLCLELIELKQASEVDFQDNIISNYSSFIRVFRETEGINNEVMQLKHYLMAQKQLVRNLMDGAYLKAVADDPMDTFLDEFMLDDQNPTTFFKTCSDVVLETLDNLLFEHRLEEALDIFEIEDGDSPKVKFQEDISPDVWMCYKSDMAERRVMLADKLTLVADNTRVSAAELQKSLVGLSRLGFDHLATRLLLKYYHTRIASGVNNMQSSAAFLPEIYIHHIAKYVFSMMFQAARSFVVLHGETSPYASELMRWACEETEAFSACFNRHVESISKINGGLSMVVNSVHVAMSYCSMLESQKLVLRPCLIENILPCMEDILKAHFNHFKKVISIFTSSDIWVMGRYSVSGILSKGCSSMVFEQRPEYCLLTNSGRKFVSLVQDVIEDVSSSITILGSSILEELMDLFTDYTSILEKALTNETGDAVEGASRIKIAASLSEKVAVIANLSTLEHFFSSLIRNLFKDINQLENVINDHMVSLASTCRRLRTHFCKQFIHSIMSNEASCIVDHVDSDLLQDLMPSLPYQVLFLELRKVEELAEENVAEFDWLVSLLTELVETTFDWISINGEIQMTHDNEDTTDQQSDRLTQFALDMQFLVEIARRGGYLTTNMINSSTNIVLQMESAAVSAGFDLNRYVIDYEKAANLATEAIKELEAQEEQKLHLDDDIDQLVEEDQPHSSNDSIEDDDTQNSSEISFEETSDDKYASTKANSFDLGADDLKNDGSIHTGSWEDEKDADFVENGLKEIKKGKLQKLSLSRMMNAESWTENADADDETRIENEVVELVTTEIEQVRLTTSDELLQLQKIMRVSKVVREQQVL